MLGYHRTKPEQVHHEPAVVLEHRYQPVVLESHPWPTGLRWGPAPWTHLLEAHVMCSIVGSLIQNRSIQHCQYFQVVKLFGGNNHGIISELCFCYRKIRLLNQIFRNFIRLKLLSADIQLSVLTELNYTLLCFQAFCRNSLTLSGFTSGN